MKTLHRPLIRALVFAAIVIALDRVVARAFEVAMPWAAARGGSGAGGEGTVYVALQRRAPCVVLGHSRARHCYDPRVLSAGLHIDTFNAGKNGQGLWYTRGMVDLLTRTYGPELYIIDIDPQSIVYQRRQHDAISYLAPQMDRSPVIRGIILGQRTLEPIKYLSRSFRFNSQLVHLVSNATRPDPTIDGFSPLTTRFDPAHDPDASEGWGRDAWVADPELEAMLGATLDQAAGAGARVFLVTSPVWNRTGTLDPRQPPFIDRVRAIAAARGVPWLIVTGETHPEFLDPALFADAGHLNEIGSAKFSELVGAWVAGQVGRAP